MTNVPELCVKLVGCKHVGVGIYAAVHKFFGGNKRVAYFVAWVLQLDYQLFATFCNGFEYKRKAVA